MCSVKAWNNALAASLASPMINGAFLCRAQVALDPTKDVVLQLYASEGCEPCVTMVMYYNRLAGRVHGSAESQAQMNANVPGGRACLTDALPLRARPHHPDRRAAGRPLLAPRAAQPHRA